jgi:cell division protein FtsZ
MEMPCTVAIMDASNILIAGVGGIGCAWAHQAFQRCQGAAHLALIDADETSFQAGESIHNLRLGHALDSVGCAALPPLAEQRMRGLSTLTTQLLGDTELVILLTGLGGGVGTGAAQEFARQARQSGAIVLAVAGLPFEAQPTRLELAMEGLTRLESTAHVTVRLSLERLARQARERGQLWQMGAEWIEDLVDGLVRTLMRMGLINLDLMDLRAIVNQTGEATMLVGIGRPDDPRGILESALKAPLAEMDVSGAKGCLIQVEGGLGMTIGQVTAVADLFTSAVDDDAQLIFGARVSEDLEDTIRVVTLLSGIQSD